jgi:hypothetical protein
MIKRHGSHALGIWASCCASAFYILFVVAIAMLSPKLLADQRTPAPKGWMDRVAGDTRYVSKKNATIEVGPWVDLGGESVDVWVAKFETSAPDGAVVISSKGVRPDSKGAYSVNREIAYGSQSGHSMLYACPGRDDTARLLQFHMKGQNVIDLISGGRFLQQVCNEETGGLATAKTLPAAPSKRLAKTESNTRLDSVAAGSPPKGFKEIRGVIVMGIKADGMFGLTEDFIALFEDGSYTSDLSNTFGSSASASKKRKPKSWGQWRTRAGKLEIKEYKEKSFSMTRGDWVARPASDTQVLSGCYGRLNSTSGGDYNSGTTVGVARTWCFWPNGRFTNSSTAFGNSTDGGRVTMKATTPKSRGRYRVKGYTAHFVYDDGHEVIAAFCFANEKKSHIVLNGKRFMGRDRNT